MSGTTNPPPGAFLPRLPRARSDRSLEDYSYVTATGDTTPRTLADWMADVAAQASTFRSSKDISYSGAASAAGNSAIYWSGDVSGTASGEVYLNLIGVDSDQIAAGGNQVNALKVLHNFGGGNATGNFGGLYVVLNQAGVPNESAERYYTALRIVAQGQFNAGGDAVTHRGHLFGANPNVRLLSGATYWEQIVGEEVNVALGATATVHDKIGFQIVKTSADAAKGDRDNIAFAIGDQVAASSSGVGWDIGISFGAYSGYNAIAATGTLIGATANAHTGNNGTVAYGIDWSLYTFSGAPIVMPLKTPSSASAAGKAGSLCWDADYIYICTATDTWKRVAIATWP